MTSVTQEKLLTDDSPVLPVTEQTAETPVKDSPISTSSVQVPKLGTGPEPVTVPDSGVGLGLGTGLLPDAMPKPEERLDVKDDSQVGKEQPKGRAKGEKTSAELLGAMAKPKVFTGPKVELQKDIVV